MTKRVPRCVSCSEPAMPGWTTSEVQNRRSAALSEASLQVTGMPVRLHRQDGLTVSGGLRRLASRTAGEAAAARHQAGTSARALRAAMNERMLTTR